MRNKVMNRNFYTKCIAYGLLGALLIFLHGAFLSPPLQGAKAPSRNEGASFSASDLPKLLSGLNSSNFKKQLTLKDEAGRRLSVNLTIEPSLQDYVVKLASETKALQTSVVVIDPFDGRILAMADHDEWNRPSLHCLKADYPAASLFKIVSAAAAIEKAGFTPDKNVCFDGGQHTLYKRQVKNNSSKYGTTTTFKKAFASSINPVFGKLGIYNLGRSALNEFGTRFYFNRQIPFEMPLEPSRMEAPEDAFGLAELASGFNKETLISPLHAALLAAAAANGGLIVRPRIVESVRTEQGTQLYEGKFSALARAMGANTAEALRVLMRETVLKGTCRRAFGKLLRVKALKGVELGAKTGTINDKLDRFKYDWTVAYASPRSGAGAIAVAVLNVHGKKLGLRANETASMVIRHRFR
jgi:cell division protein FtsI/penicillin-binding protein 2